MNRKISILSALSAIIIVSFLAITSSSWFGENAPPQGNNEIARNTILIPSLSSPDAEPLVAILPQNRNGTSLLTARLIGEKEDVPVHYYEDNDNGNAVFPIPSDANVLMLIPEGVDILAVTALGEPRLDRLARYWGYRFSGQEEENRLAGKTGIGPDGIFNGDFILSGGLRNASPHLSPLHNPSLRLRSGDLFHVMGDDLSLTESATFFIPTDTTNPASPGNLLGEGVVDSEPLGIAFRDRDNDGCNDYAEQMYGLDPNNADTDNDGLQDGQELYYYNPPNAEDFALHPQDAGNDLTNYIAWINEDNNDSYMENRHASARSSSSSWTFSSWSFSSSYDHGFGHCPSSSSNGSTPPNCNLNYCPSGTCCVQNACDVRCIPCGNPCSGPQGCSENLCCLRQNPDDAEGICGICGGTTCSEDADCAPVETEEEDQYVCHWNENHAACQRRAILDWHCDSSGTCRNRQEWTSEGCDGNCLDLCANLTCYPPWHCINGTCAFTQCSSDEDCPEPIESNCIPAFDEFFSCHRSVTTYSCAANGFCQNNTIVQPCDCQET